MYNQLMESLVDVCRCDCNGEGIDAAQRTVRGTESKTLLSLPIKIGTQGLLPAHLLDDSSNWCTQNSAERLFMRGN